MGMRTGSKLIELDWPRFGGGDRPADPTVDELLTKLGEIRILMSKRELTHLVVYGDREHFANIRYLSGYDPRFEEALLIISEVDKPLLLVGNEGEGYLSVSPLFRAGELRTERFQPFSLLDQPRGDSRYLKEILAAESIDEGSRIGCIGWKYFSESEHSDSSHAIEVPSYIVDTLRDLAGRANVVNVTDMLMHPGAGLRSKCTASEIAYFEYTNVLASEGVKRMIFGMREGASDFDVAKLAGYNGEPLACHMTFITSENQDTALSGPIGAKIKVGDPIALNVAYWGSNIARAGWICNSAEELPPPAKDYVESFVGPYFTTVARWLENLKIGTRGKTLHRIVAENLPFAKFGIFLNAGHLIHLDEWLSSPVYEDSDIELHSGMALQVDIIPSSETYFSTRVEDGIVIADESLRQQVREQYPGCYGRCQKRRSFMADTLGIDLPEEVLPLSNMVGIIPPYFLNPNTVLSMDR